MTPLRLTPTGDTNAINPTGSHNKAWGRRGNGAPQSTSRKRTEPRRGSTGRALSAQSCATHGQCGTPSGFGSTRINSLGCAALRRPQASLCNPFRVDRMRNSPFFPTGGEPMRTIRRCYTNAIDPNGVAPLQLTPTGSHNKAWGRRGQRRTPGQRARNTGPNPDGVPQDASSLRICPCAHMAIVEPRRGSYQRCINSLGCAAGAATPGFVVKPVPG